ncbi:INO80 complex subunit D [Drosophila serrata]|uniref:INO80 complex subunit D n=1 Tax=Drosophila serrata TaxID=7274 RepID=UPI000A1D3805|nr:INO80 complex subunit D [Drosophila serrata]
MRPTPKSESPLLLLALLLLLGVGLLASGTDAVSSYGASFISNPAIYAYSVENQQEQEQGREREREREREQDQEQNDIKFAATNANANGNSNSNLNRNYYYTSDPNQSPNVNSYVNPTPALATPPATQPAPQTGCTLDRLAVYKVVLHTYWTRELFPKHYPDWRPTAQWTKTLGRTHNANYALYHIGQPATAAVKQFAETGRSDLLDSNAGEQQQQQMQTGKSPTVSSSATSSTSTSTSQSTSTSGGAPVQERSVFDEFSMPAIPLGAGRSEAKVFVDSNHSLVSLMTRIVPSPDWYIGVDSFELCVGGSWIDTVTVELDPLDAGTDNGFTFTAPNWPTAPQGVIYRITSRYPGHPAGSFYYPKSKRLPPIATFQFIKLKEYELSEVFNIAEDDRKYETVQTQTHLDAEHNHVEMNNELSASIERERQTEQQQSQQQQQQQQQHQQQQQQQQLQQFDERQRIRSQLLAKMNPIYSYNNSQQPAPGQVVSVVPKNDKHAILQSIASSYRRATDSGRSLNTFNLTQSQHTNGTSGGGTSSRRRSSSQRRRDCRVSHWSEWTTCSKSCGIGEMHRYRKVIKHGKRGGRPCPALQQSKWCGTERNCHGSQTYFNWSDSDT